MEDGRSETTGGGNVWKVDIVEVERDPEEASSIRCFRWALDPAGEREEVGFVRERNSDSVGWSALELRQFACQRFDRRR